MGSRVRGLGTSARTVSELSDCVPALELLRPRELRGPAGQPPAASFFSSIPQNAFQRERSVSGRGFISAATL